jgi:CRP-like cAMP-binding protein
MWDLLLKNIAAKGVVLTEAEQAIVCELFTHRKLRKNQYILQQDDVAKHEYFVVKGITRTYLVDNKGNEHVIKFSPEDWWAGDLYSFFSGQPSSYNIDCLEDTEILQITREGLDRLYREVPKMYAYFCNLYTNSIIAYNRRVADSLHKTALDRYRDFISRYPQIEQRVPNHQIASFLGIKPQSLSRLRKQLVHS